MFVAVPHPWRVAALVCAILGASGCANQKQYADFAQAGVATSDAITTILPIHAQTYLDPSSERPLADRVEMPGAQTLAFSPREYRETPPEEFARRSCDDLKEMQLLAELQAHMALMRRYFAGLDAVASAQASADAGAIVKDLSATGTAMKATMAAPAIAVSSVTGLVLNTAISGALRARPQADQQTIHTELALEKQLLTKLDRDLAAYQTDLFALKFQRTVVVPYADGPPSRRATPGSPKIAGVVAT